MSGLRTNNIVSMTYAKHEEWDILVKLNFHAN